MYIQSDNIKVFPTSKRDDAQDRNARLTSEQNLISIVNRLADKRSFIIGDGLKVKNNQITPGACNINGYWFNILNNIDIRNLNATNNQFLCFKITLTKSTLSQSLIFEELQNGDLDGEYKGLEIVVVDSYKDSEDQNIYYLPIAQYTASGWKSVNAVDNKIKYSGNSLSFNLPANTTTGNQNDETLTLQDFINNRISDLIIDDGELQ